MSETREGLCLRHMRVDINKLLHFSHDGELVRVKGGESG